jgi:hypothetical protein
LSAAEYEVLTAWIDAKLIGNERSGTKNAKQFVIFDTTNSGDNHLLPDGNGQAVPWEKTAESLRKADPALQQGTLDEFRKVNARQGFLRRSFHPSIDYVIVNSAQLEFSTVGINFLQNLPLLARVLQAISGISGAADIFTRRIQRRRHAGILLFQQQL